MPISVDWPSKVISVPQSYLTHLSGSRYQLDTEQFRLDLKDLEDDPLGIAYVDTHRRNAPVTLSGATYAQTLEIINGYTITFEDVGTPYRVSLVGSNNNIADVTNVNQVSIQSNNSAGLIQVVSGSGVLPQDITDIKNAVWDEDLGAHTTPGTAGKVVSDTEANSDVTQAAVGH
jgi:hypothetical protein